LLFWRGVAKGHFEGRSEFGFAQRRERRTRPAPPAPGVIEGCKRVRRISASERLFIGREFDVGAQFVWRERGEGYARLEGAAIEMGIFAGALETRARCGGSLRP